MIVGAREEKIEEKGKKAKSRSRPPTDLKQGTTSCYRKEGALLSSCKKDRERWRIISIYTSYNLY